MLERLLKERFSITTIMQGERYSEKNYDLIYPLEWNLVPKNFIKTPAKYVTGIRSHVSWEKLDFFPFIEYLSNSFNKINVVSKRLKRLFEPFLPGVEYVTHGVDVEYFKSKNRADISAKGTLRVGWAGNRVNKLKGFDNFIKPLGQLPGVQLVVCGYLDENLSIEAMRSFYDSIDVYVCASLHEGNNNSVLEAASMQRAVVTTNSGTVEEFLEDGKSALIVEREMPAFINAMLNLRDDPNLRVYLGNNARDSVKRHFDWKLMANKHLEYFLTAINQADKIRDRVFDLNSVVHYQKDSKKKYRGTLVETQEVSRGKLAKLYAGNRHDSLFGTSFCIITDGSRLEKLQLELHSIKKLGMPKYEILIAGILPKRMSIDGFKYFPMIDAARQGRLGEMRNKLCREAKFPNLIVSDDDMIFHKDFYTKLVENGDDYDVLCVRLLNPDGTRFWDWATYGGPAGHKLLDYSEKNDPFRYVTGGLCVIKRNVARSVQWNDTLSFYQKEDIDFSRRLQQAGYEIKLCSDTTVLHNDNRYTQVGDHVARLEEVLNEAVSLTGFFSKDTDGRRWMSSDATIYISSSHFPRGFNLYFKIICFEKLHYSRFPFNISISERSKHIGLLSFEASHQAYECFFRFSQTKKIRQINLRSDSYFSAASSASAEDERRLSVAMFDLKIEQSCFNPSEVTPNRFWCKNIKKAEPLITSKASL
jgi:hypothetical protein